jgi:hypothetical protein
VRERNGIVIAKPAEGHLHVQTYGMRARLATVIASVVVCIGMTTQQHEPSWVIVDDVSASDENLWPTADEGVA